MKKILSVVLSIIFVLSLCACNAQSYALSVDGTRVSDEIYGYYLSVAVNSSQYSKKFDKEQLAGELCAEYIAAKRLIEQYGIQLSAEEKVVVSQEVKVNWQLYSSFYEKYSVSKQTLCEVTEHEKLVDSLVKHIYGAGGEKALSDDDILKFFNQNYAVIKIISTDFTIDMDDAQIQDITDKFTSMRNTIRTGGDFSSAAQQYPDLAEYEDVEHVISSSDSSYPDGMFKKILELKQGDTQVLRYSRGIYLIQKANAADYFDVYKNDCILKLKKAEILGAIKADAETYTLDFNNSVVSKINSKADI